MTKRMFAALALGGALILSGCSDSPAPQSKSPAADTSAATQPSDSLSGTVAQTMNAAGYTYVEFDTGSEKIWLAGPQAELTVGQTITIYDGMAMENFHSPSLDRTFEVLYFVAGFGDAQSPVAAMPAGHPTIKPAVSEGDFSGITIPDGGLTIQQIYNQMAELSGTQITLRGKVVRFNSGIMGTNWVHVQDGTGKTGSNDLTITTDALVQVGDTVLIQGTLVTDRDFGHGYHYDLLVEDATVRSE